MLLVQSKELKTETESFEIAKGKLSSYKNLKLASCTNPKLSSYKNPKLTSSKNPKLTSYKDPKLTFICWSGRHPLISPIWQTMQKLMVSHDKCALLLTLILNESMRVVDRFIHKKATVRSLLSPGTSNGGLDPNHLKSASESSFR